MRGPSTGSAPLLAAEGGEAEARRGVKRSPKGFCAYPFRHVNHNVVVNLCMRCCFGLADGIWSSTVLPAFLFNVGGNRFAGFLEAAMGVANLAVALPAGYAADRTGKARVVFCGGCLVPIAIGLSVLAITWSYEHPRDKAAAFGLFVAALSLWGAVQAINNGVAQALYADSVAAGERSRYFQYSFSLNM